LPFNLLVEKLLLSGDFTNLVELAKFNFFFKNLLGLLNFLDLEEDIFNILAFLGLALMVSGDFQFNNNLSVLVVLEEALPFLLINSPNFSFLAEILDFGKSFFFLQKIMDMTSLMADMISSKIFVQTKIPNIITR
jgi:hypothetical protein